MEKRALGRTADDAAKVHADHVEPCRSVEAPEDQRLLPVGVPDEGIGGPGRPPLFAPRGSRDLSVIGIDIGRGSELGEDLGVVEAVPKHGVLVGGPERHVAAPGLAALRLQVGAVVDEQLEELRASTTADSMGEEGAFVRVCARFEQHAHRLDPVVIERVCEPIGAGRLGPVVEEKP